VTIASNPAVRGDALAGVLIAEAATAAAASLVEINLAGRDDADLARARDARRRAQEAREDALATLPRS
jgi:formiminotetrahydrofolate cyclodeaminase